MLELGHPPLQFADPLISWTRFFGCPTKRGSMYCPRLLLPAKKPVTIRLTNPVQTVRSDSKIGVKIRDLDTIDIATNSSSYASAIPSGHFWN